MHKVPPGLQIEPRHRVSQPLSGATAVQWCIVASDTLCTYGSVLHSGEVFHSRGAINRLMLLLPSINSTISKSRTTVQLSHALKAHTQS